MKLVSNQVDFSGSGIHGMTEAEAGAAVLRAFQQVPAESKEFVFNLIHDLGGEGAPAPIVSVRSGRVLQLVQA